MDLTAESCRRLRLVDEHGEPKITPDLLTKLLAQIESPARFIVVEGARGSFSEGLDLSFLKHERSEARYGGEQFDRLLTALAQTPSPVIALVDGPALGAGCALAAVADVVLSTSKATFGLPEVLWGLIPAVAFRFVARRTGVPRARGLALSGVAVDAMEAHRWGLVDGIVPDLDQALLQYVRRFGRADARALGEVKALATMLETDGFYREAALRRFYDLAKSDSARARIAKFETGEVPWSDLP